MIYIVSGYMRTGTSMMMDALARGGLEPAFNESRNQMNTQYGDEWYKPNDNGFFEMEVNNFNHLYAQPLDFDNCLVKVLFPGLKRLGEFEYRVVFMRRDPVEIKESIISFFGKLSPKSKQVLDNYYSSINKVIRETESRIDVKSLTVFPYAAVVERPLVHFSELVRAGWPIDAKLAATIPEVKFYRHRREVMGF